MGLFKKKTQEIEGSMINSSQPPLLPKLPQLPEIPGMESRQFFKEPPIKLPKYPSNPLGNQFSQNIIKDAVTGKKEDDFGDEDDFEQFEKLRKIPMPNSQLIRNNQESISKEPVFIRIDKFEESLNIFQKAQKQIDEIENMLSDIKKVREDENREIDHWEKEMQNIKIQIEKIDKDIFSKVN